MFNTLRRICNDAKKKIRGERSGVGIYADIFHDRHKVADFLILLIGVIGIAQVHRIADLNTELVISLLLLGILQLWRWCKLGNYRVRSIICNEARYKVRRSGLQRVTIKIHWRWRVSTLHLFFCNRILQLMSCILWVWYWWTNSRRHFKSFNDHIDSYYIYPG